MMASVSTNFMSRRTLLVPTSRTSEASDIGSRCQKLRNPKRESKTGDGDTTAGDDLHRTHESQTRLARVFLFKAEHKSSDKERSAKPHCDGDCQPDRNR